MEAVKLSIHGHPLVLREFSSVETEESRLCSLCGETVEGSGYDCSLCDFAAHLGCVENPPPPVIEKSNIHPEHTLTLLPRKVSFTCNACGLDGDKSPYVCLTCSLMIHKDCTSFPEAIKISRHQHSITHTFFLGGEKRSCGVCRKVIDRRYGAYSCLDCRDYAVHTTCAVRKDVWDGTERQGPTQEELEKEEMLFVPIGDDDKLIRHKSHNEHILTLENEDGGGGLVQPDKVRCYACSFPISYEPFYRCDSNLCEFFLHQKCAHLPSTNSTFLHQHPLTLCTEDDRRNLSRCGACGLYFNGFIYRCLQCNIDFDVRCCSVTEPVVHHLHPHPLFFSLRPDSICNVCDLEGSEYLISCIECDGFGMCLACATLPGEVTYKYDEHLLSHFFDEKLTGLFCCDLCENKIGEKGNHYKCSACGPVLHMKCLLGSTRNIRPGFCYTAKNGCKYEVILNDRQSLRNCSQCGNDCHEPLLFMATTSTDVTTYLCSLPCFLTL